MPVSAVWPDCSGLTAFFIPAERKCSPLYQALYRKWRPQIFDDVVGQSHITQTLKKQVQTNRLSHAYLFTGTRGTGKTTCAKILAKAVNCESPIQGNPCGKCPACVGIEQDAAVIPVGFSIPKTTSEEHKELVYKFVDYWNSEEICTRWTQECGTPAYLISAQENFADDPLTLALSEPLSYGHIECKMKGVNSISADALYPAMEEIFAGADVKTTLDKYNEVIQGILDN